VFLTGGSDVDPLVVEHFHRRSGYSRPAEAVDPGALESVVKEDLVGAGVPVS
jgi:hypothetical protein